MQFLYVFDNFYTLFYFDTHTDLLQNLKRKVNIHPFFLFCPIEWLILFFCFFVSFFYFEKTFLISFFFYNSSRFIIFLLKNIAMQKRSKGNPWKVFFFIWCSCIMWRLFFFKFFSCLKFFLLLILSNKFVFKKLRKNERKKWPNQYVNSISEKKNALGLIHFFLLLIFFPYFYYFCIFYHESHYIKERISCMMIYFY